MSIWKLSAGTAGIIGLKPVKNTVPPTTAYIMLGERCRNNCKFCAQARESKAGAAFLSRVTWSEAEAAEAAAAIATAFGDGKLKRACLQVVDIPDSFEAVRKALRRINEQAPIPVCVSSHIATSQQARQLIESGADRISLALDAATQEVFEKVKDGDWQARRKLLSECAAVLPGRVSTHLIVGLGETEEEMVDVLDGLITEGIGVGLFAFTPVRGTAWGDRSAPSIGQYRRIQVAYYLLKNKFPRSAIIIKQGIITGFAVPDFKGALAGGKAFETSGCDGCNRPFYNERPGGVMYNYPRPLSLAEFDQALAECALEEEQYEVAAN